MQKEIAFVTTNPYKAREVKEILSSFSINIKQLFSFSIEIQSDKIEEIARISAIEAAKKSRQFVLVEDSGLFIESLNGFPGPYSSYIQKTIGNDGILKLMKGIKDRKATFRSAVGFCTPNDSPLIFVGEVHGRISQKERGRMWAFDPIFIPNNTNNTYAEMSREKKNKISHRKKALEKFALWFKKGFPNS